MPLQLRDYQIKAVEQMKNGCILCGGVGSGKSRTALAYYFTQEGGEIKPGEYIPMKPVRPRDLYIITTARKRDTLEWEGELVPFLLSTDPNRNKFYSNKVVVDSWNNIGKYSETSGAFFIFDEQRVVGNGAWVKTFLKITKVNDWILLSATPGDCWSDYIPVFLANGFYRNKTEFTREHCVYSRFTKYPKIDRYINEGRLIRLRNQILVDMDFNRETVSHHENIFVQYDVERYKEVCRTRKDPYTVGYIPCWQEDEGALLIGTDIAAADVYPILEGWCYTPIDGEYVRLANKPIKTASELCYIWRKIVNTDESRVVALLEILDKTPKAIIFYNFDYELELLMGLAYIDGTKVAQWSGHKHEAIPASDRWVYLVQYTAGAEGWNCIETDTVIFFSQNYSYKVLEQSRGRIDRMNTPFKDLYYYHLKSRAGIDLAIAKALKDKKRFNERKFAMF